MRSLYTPNSCSILYTTALVLLAVFTISCTNSSLSLLVFCSSYSTLSRLSRSSASFLETSSILSSATCWP